MGTRGTSAPPIGGRGEMAARIRDFDWSTTPLGPIDRWPRALRSTVDLILHSGYPMLLAWGPGYTQIYNDGYLPILGMKHPRALGQPLLECWFEVRDMMAPLFDRVRDTGEPVWQEDLLLVLHRTGKPEECWFTFSYGAVRDEDGRVAGVLSTALETTRRVLGERELRRAREEAEGEHERVVRILEGISDPFLAFDAELRCIYVNRRGADLFGRPREELFGRYVHELFAEPVAEARRALEAAAQDRTTKQLDVYWPALDRWFSCHVHPSPDGVTIYGRDVTAERAAREARDRMLSVISHDLRNPLNAMGIIGNLLLSPSVREERRAEHVLTLNRLVVRMATLIRDLLDLAAIERGDLSVAPSAEDLTSIVADGVDSLRPVAVEKSILLRMEVPDDLPAVRADRRRLAQAVSNLVDNAVRFTAEGGTVVIRARRIGDDAEVAVEDAGCGIAPDDLTHVFDRFWKKKQAGQSGAGLGLAIVRGIVEAHGGRVRVESEEGKGATFYFTVPLAGGVSETAPAAVSQTRH